MKRLGVLVAATMLSAPVAFAVTATPLPSSARLLTAREVIALYDGATLAFDNYEFDKSIRGTSHLDFKKGVIHGDYAYGGAEKRTFKGTIRMKRNNFCYTIGKTKKTA